MDEIIKNDPAADLTRERLNVTEVAKIYGCSVPTIWRWSSQGVIPKPRKFGGTTSWGMREILADARRPANEAAT